MKKLITASLLFLLSHLPSFSQVNEVKFGVQVFPSIAWTRVTPDSYTDPAGTTYTFSSNGGKLRGGIGIFADYHFTDNYVFTTGVNYLLNASGFQVTVSNPLAPGLSGTGTKTYSLQYVQVPIAFKLVTNEFVDMIRAYFKVGITGDVLVGTRIDGKSSYQPAPGSPVIQNSRYISLFSTNLNLSPGIEYEIAGGTRLLIGVTYSRGLMEINSNKSKEFFGGNDISGFSLKNDYISLDLGVKF